MVPLKSAISVIFAVIGLIFTVWGMFTVSQTMVWMGVGFWIASVVSGRLLKKKSKVKEDSLK